MNQVFDFIIIGAGSSGSAIAARLTESGRYTVLLIEAGDDDRWPWIRIPAGVAKILVGQRALWGFQAEPSDGLNGRRLPVPRGKLLGGTSGINGMFWVRGDPKEYDRWRDLGNRGWGYDDILPYFIRMESYAKGDASLRGHSGPLYITEYSPRDALTNAFLVACSQAGIPENSDYNGRLYYGAGLMQLSTRRGLRWSVREGYLRPAMKRPNLSIATNAHVTKVLFDGVRAVGVCYSDRDELRRALAAREIVLCAGAVQSPQLLELSGVGAPEVLRRSGIETIMPLPSVGENLRDHLHARLMVRVKNAKTLNDMLSSSWGKMSMALRYAVLKNGMMSTPGATAHALVHTRPQETQPDIKLQLHHLTSSNERDPKKLVLDPFPGYSIGIVHQQPKSRGSVHITCPDPFVPPKIRPNYFAEVEDVQAYVRGVKIARQVVRQPALAHFSCQEIRPGDRVSSDEDIVNYLRETLFSSYHPVGTCRMGADEKAVVDPELRVRGLHGLRVADASIMPTIPAANTNAAAIMIGEKAADLLLEAARQSQHSSVSDTLVH